MDHEKNDLRVIDGKVVAAAEARAQEGNVVMLNDDTTRVQLMTNRILKVLGSKVKTRVTLAALAVCVGKVFTVIPQKEHKHALAEFFNLVALAVRSEYTPEEQEAARLEALAALKAKAEQDAKAEQPAQD